MYKNIGLICNDTKKAIELKKYLIKKYGFKEFKKGSNFDVLLVLGGDGFMLSTVHKYIDLKIPFYGLNCGTMGFLMNNLDKKKDLLKQIVNSEKVQTSPLEFKVKDVSGKISNEIAINEVSVLRSTHQMIRVKIEVDGIERMAELRGDGVLVSTEIGSGAYNFSANGFILPLNGQLLSLVPVSVFRPRGWRGALLDIDSKIKLTVLDPDNRKADLTADYLDFKNVKSVEIQSSKSKKIHFLFNSELPVKNKILKEQFSGE